MTQAVAWVVKTTHRFGPSSLIEIQPAHQFTLLPGRESEGLFKQFNADLFKLFCWLRLISPSGLLGPLRGFERPIPPWWNCIRIGHGLLNENMITNDMRPAGASPLERSRTRRQGTSKQLGRQAVTSATSISKLLGSTPVLCDDGPRPCHAYTYSDQSSEHHGT